MSSIRLFHKFPHVTQTYELLRKKLALSSSPTILELGGDDKTWDQLVSVLCSCRIRRRLNELYGIDVVLLKERRTVAASHPNRGFEVPKAYAQAS